MPAHVRETVAITTPHVPGDEDIGEIRTDHNAALAVEGVVVNQFLPRARLPQLVARAGELAAPAGEVALHARQARG